MADSAGTISRAMEEAEVGGYIVGMEDQGNVFVMTAMPSAGHSATALATRLQSGELTWRDLEVEDALLRLRIAMIDKMRPLPRIELELVDNVETGELEEGAEGGPCKVDLDYFKSYEDIRTHELMLRDRPRMVAYRDAILRNAEAIRGKTVLDVGCGTGILSMLAAKAGAKVVYAVEASGMAALAARLVEHNGLADVVKVMHSRIEDVQLPDKVDVIVSEWMGFYLVHESMMNSVLDARDRWLKPDGLMLPSHATIYACPVSMDQYRRDKLEFWADICGLDFTPFGDNLTSGTQFSCFTGTKVQLLTLQAPFQLLQLLWWNLSRQTSCSHSPLSLGLSLSEYILCFFLLSLSLTVCLSAR
jgi:SAM-dependent methyltransferase